MKRSSLVMCIAASMASSISSFSDSLTYGVYDKQPNFKDTNKNRRTGIAANKRKAKKKKNKKRSKR